MNPTGEQIRAIATDESRFTIRAAAGSGKTFVLTQRFLRHVTEQGIAPHKILTITFTRKAAAEMKRRIVRELTNIGRLHDAQLAETGPIQTIHSFCERVLRENSLAAGLDPQFEILSESQASTMTEESLRAAFVEAWEEDDLAREVIRHLAGKSAWGRSGADARLTGAVRRVLSSLRGSGHSPLALMNRLGEPDAMLQVWLEGIAADMGMEDSLHLPLVESLAILAKETRKRLQTRGDWGAMTEFDLRSAARESTGLLRLACMAWMELDHAMQEEQAFDFSALESLAVNLVTGDQAVGARLRSQFSAVLVDESQDVNPMQYRLIDALGIDSEMMVGDPQQSIYGFRQADRQLFINRTLSSPTLELSANFRSTPGILSFVDQLFLNIWGEDYRPMLQPSSDGGLFSDPTWPPCVGVELWPSEAKDSVLTAERISQLIAEGERPGDIAVLVRDKKDALNIADHLKARGIPHLVSGGTERFYTRMEVRDVANALQALVDPLDQFAWLAFLHSPFAGFSLDAIATLAQFEIVPDALPEWVPPTEADAAKKERLMIWMPPLLSRAGRIPAWELIGALYARSPYLETLARRPDAAQILANARKLLRLASELPLASAGEFAETIRDIQILQHKEGDAPAEDDNADLVTLMTIHKAKGLEWPVVVVPGHFKNLDARWQDLEVDPQTGAVASNFTYKDHPGKTWLHARKKLSQRQEELRVLYVALTRAQRRLCVGISQAPSANTLAGIVAQKSGFPDRLWAGVNVRDDVRSS